MRFVSTSLSKWIFSGTIIIISILLGVLEQAEAALLQSFDVVCLPEEPDVCVGHTLKGHLHAIPFPDCYDPDAPENVECTYMPGYSGQDASGSVTYEFVQGLQEGNYTYDIYFGNDTLRDLYFTGLTVRVSYSISHEDEEDFECIVKIGEEACSSCSRDGCGIVPGSIQIDEISRVSADCTNIPNGRMVECEATSPIFYPLVWDYSNNSTTAAPSADDSAEWDSNSTAAPSADDSAETSAENPKDVLDGIADTRTAPDLESDGSTKALEIKTTLTFTFYNPIPDMPTTEEITAVAEASKDFFSHVFLEDPNFQHVYDKIAFTNVVPEYNALATPDEFSLHFLTTVVVDGDAKVTAHQASQVIGDSNFQAFLHDYIKGHAVGEFDDTFKVFFRGTTHV